MTAVREVDTADSVTKNYSMSFLLFISIQIFGTHITPIDLSRYGMSLLLWFLCK